MVMLNKLKKKIIQSTPIFDQKPTLTAKGAMQEEFSRYVNENLTKNELETFLSKLDRASIEVATRIISRLQSSYNQKYKKFQDLTEEEKQRLNFLKSSPLSNPIKTYTGNDIAWCYLDYFLPENHFESSVFLDHHGIHLFENFEKIRNKNIIDVGGFIGDSAIVLERYTDKNVYTFEATRSNYEKILKTIHLNNSQRIIPVNQGLGSKNEEMEISCNGSESSLVYSKTSNDSKEKIAIITLDQYVQEHKIDVGLIKVDIEGYEMEFLKGALDTIKTQRPSMILSIYHSPKDFFGIKPFIDSLNLGYRFKVFKPIDKNVLIETCLLCEALD